MLMEVRSTSRRPRAPGASTARRRRGQRGVALVDLGRVFTLENRLKNAAQAGAVYAQLFPNQVTNTGACADPANITYKALQEDSGATSGFTVSVTNSDTNTAITGCQATTVSPGTHVKVTVQANFAVLTPFISNFIGNPVTVKGTSEVVVQG